MTSNSTGEGSSQPSIDPPGLIDILKQLLDKVALLERDNERLRAENAEHKLSPVINSPLSSSIDHSELIIPLKQLLDKVALLERNAGPPELADLLKSLPTKVALLERDNERLRAENEAYKNSPQFSSIDPSELVDLLKSLPTKVASVLEHDLGRLRKENEQQKKEINQMSSTFKTAFALKNRKIKDLEALVEQLLNGKEGEVSNTEVKRKNSGGLEKSDETAVVFAINDKLQKGNVKHADTRNIFVTECGIRAKLADISKLDDEVISIGTIELHQLTWIIMAYKHQAHLGFLLVNNDFVSNGFPTASVTLISPKFSEFNYSKPLPNLKKLNKYCVCSKFISFKDLFDEKKGFVKGDSIIVDVIIKPANNSGLDFWPRPGREHEWRINRPKGRVDAN